MPLRYSAVWACQISPWAREEEVSCLAVLLCQHRSSGKLNWPLCCWFKWWVGRQLLQGSFSGIQSGITDAMPLAGLWGAVHRKGEKHSQLRAVGRVQPQMNTCAIAASSCTAYIRSWEPPSHGHTEIHILLGSCIDVWDLFISVWVIMPKSL